MHVIYHMLSVFFFSILTFMYSKISIQLHLTYSKIYLKPQRTVCNWREIYLTPPSILASKILRPSQIFFFFGVTGQEWMSSAVYWLMVIGKDSKLFPFYFFFLICLTLSGCIPSPAAVSVRWWEITSCEMSGDVFHTKFTQPKKIDIRKPILLLPQIIM